MIGESNWTDAGSFLFKRRDEVIPTQQLNQKFHACFHSRFALTISIEEAQNRSGEIENLFGGKEFSVKLRQMRRTAQPTAEIHSKPALNLAIHFTGSGPEAYVVNAQGGMIFGAAFEGNLELAPQVLVVLVSHQVTEQSFGIRPDVKGLAGRCSGAVTRRDIAHGISTSLTCSNSSLGQKTQERRRFFEFHVIYLCIFARGEMHEAAAELIRGGGQSLKLIRRQEAAGKLDALHLHALLTLGIGAKVQAHLLHLCFVQLAGEIVPDLLFVPRQLIPHIRGKNFKL